MSSSREIRLIDEPDGGWSAIDVDTNVASQGETRAAALENLDEALALYKGETGESIEDETEFLEELGIDPDEVTGENEDDRPPFLS